MRENEIKDKEAIEADNNQVDVNIKPDETKEEEVIKANEIEAGESKVSSEDKAVQNDVFGKKADKKSSFKKGSKGKPVVTQETNQPTSVNWGTQSASAAKKGFSGNLKVLLFNAAIAVLCIVSILTLWLGDFVNTDVKLTVKKDNIKEWFGKGEQKSDESNEANNVKTAAPENEGKKKSLFDGNMSSEEMSDMLFDYIPDDFKLEFTVNFTVNGQTLAKSAVGQKEEAVQDLIAKQVDSVVNEVDKTLVQIIEVAKEIIVSIINDSLDELKVRIRQEIEKQLQENDMTAEQLDEYLDKLGDNLTMKLVDDLIDYVAEEPVQKLTNGDVNAARNLIMNNDTTRKILRTIAKLEVLEEKNVNLKETAKEDIATFFAEEENSAAVESKIAEAEKKVNDVYDEYVPKLADETGTITSESLVVGLINLIDEMTNKDEEKASNAAEGEGEGKQIKSLEDVKAFIVEKINEVLDEETKGYIGDALSYLGYFLFFVMLCWFYVLVKVIVKTAFFKNKTVGLFAARFFGWMPHVFFVGIPMTVLLFKDKILAAMTSNGMNADDIKPYLDMVSINVHSLAWISALATVVLLVMLFFYYPMRREEKRAKKAARRAA